STSRRANASRRAGRTKFLERHDASTEQFHAGAAVHLPPQRLEPIDVAFDRPIAPRFRDGPFYRGEIPTQRADELLQRPDLRVMRLHHPAVERRDVAVSQTKSQCGRSCAVMTSTWRQALIRVACTSSGQSMSRL